ncbi:hypothetical protein JCM8097_000579 [Rhodosporidiobolus ruineniae]
MPAWRQRRKELDQALAELAGGGSSPDEQLHLELLRDEQAGQRPQDLRPPQKRLRTLALAPDDFPSLSTLSSSGHFSRVELVRPSAALSDAPGANAAVYVLKTVDRRWAFRMREQQHLRHELAVLRLGLASPASPARIPRLVASFLSPASFYILLEHVPGGDLWSVLERKNEVRGPGQEVGLPEEWVRRWMAELVDAVEWLRGKGWAHRDIKPQNLLLQADGHLLLTDFGSAAPLSPASSSIARKYCRALVGTPDYIAPETLRHAERVFEETEAAEEDGFEDGGEEGEGDPEERAYGAEVDVWACGVVLYELLTGTTPFFADEIRETYERIVNWKDHLTFPSSSPISSAARKAIQSLLVAPEDRPSFAGIKSLPFFADIDWRKLRNTPAAYTPPPFTAPPFSPSFSRSAASFQASDLSYSSFFSSPGLSILRPSPRTASAAQREEREYWDAREFGGLTTLPAADEFDHPTSASFSFPSASRPANPPTPASSAFETPARPFFRPSRTATGNVATSTPAPASSGRSRRMISDIDAWREMQEHAWVVGMSARKSRQTPGSAAAPTAAVTRPPLSPVPAPRPLMREKKAVGEGMGRKNLNGLEKQQEEMVQRLEAMESRYQFLFDAAAKGQ